MFRKGIDSSMLARMSFLSRGQDFQGNLTVFSRVERGGRGTQLLLQSAADSSPFARTSRYFFCSFSM